MAKNIKNFKNMYSLNPAIPLLGKNDNRCVRKMFFLVLFKILKNWQRNIPNRGML